MQGIPILSVAFNEMHAKYIKQHVVSRIFNAMMAPSSPAWLFEPALVELVAKESKKQKLGAGSSLAPSSGSPAPPAAGAAGAAEAAGDATAAGVAAATTGPAQTPTGSPAAAVGHGGTLAKLKQMLAERQAAAQPA